MLSNRQIPLTESEQKPVKVVGAQRDHEGFNVTGTSAVESRGSYDAAAKEAEIRERLKSPETNHVFKIADKYTRERLGKPYDFQKQVEGSSYQKQKAISDAFEMAVNDVHGYKEAVFKAYQEKRPDIVKELGATHYDDLVKKSYHAVAAQTDAQFSHIPVRMQYHQGSHTYHHSGELLNDVFHHGNMTVFQGGDKHEFLHHEDAKNGLNTNEKFRAVHDFFGHALHGNSFGAIGEETAWDSHRKMYSPGAQVAMTAETRGQNSFVNYSGINDHTIAKMKMLRSEKEKIKAAGGDASHIDHALRQIGENDWKYAPQKSVALPPEMLDPHYNGEMPHYLRALQESFDNWLSGIEEGTLEEAVSFLDPRHKKRVDGMPEMNNIVKGIHDKVFGEGVERLEIPIDRENEDVIDHNRALSAGSSSRAYHVANMLSKHGYRIADYVGGYARKEGDVNNRLHKIGGVLDSVKLEDGSKLGDQLTPFRKTRKIARSPDGRALNTEGNFLGEHPGSTPMYAESEGQKMNLKAAFDSDILRAAKKGGHVMVVSRAREDVAGMTTNQNWHGQSCMELDDGCNRHFVPKDLHHGTLVAYMTHKDHAKDETIKPIGRALIKRFDGDGGDTAFVPERRHYGVMTSSFRKAIDDFAAKHYPLDENQTYRKNSALYNDDGRNLIMRKNFNLKDYGSIVGAISGHMRDEKNHAEERAVKFGDWGEYDQAQQNVEGFTHRLMKDLPSVVRAHTVIHSVVNGESVDRGSHISDKGFTDWDDGEDAIRDWAHTTYRDQEFKNDLKDLHPEHLGQMLDKLHENHDETYHDSDYQQGKSLHHMVLSEALSRKSDTLLHKVMDHMSAGSHAIGYYNDLEYNHGSIFDQHPALHSEDPRTIHRAMDFVKDHHSDYSLPHHSEMGPESKQQLFHHIGQHGDEKLINEIHHDPEEAPNYNAIVHGLNKNPMGEHIQHALTHRLPLFGGYANPTAVRKPVNPTTQQVFDNFGKRFNGYSSHTGENRIEVTIRGQEPRTEFKNLHGEEPVDGDSIDGDLFHSIARHTVFLSVHQSLNKLHGDALDGLKDSLKSNKQFGETIKESENRQNLTGLPPEIKEKRQEQKQEREAKLKPKKSFSQFLKGEQ